MANGLVRKDAIGGIVDIEDKLWEGKTALGSVYYERTTLASSECSYR
jgi:hypothetical protein